MKFGLLRVMRCVHRVCVDAEQSVWATSNDTVGAEKGSTPFTEALEGFAMTE